MRFAAVFCLALLAGFPPAAVAQDFDLPQVTYPALPPRAASGAGFAPNGWAVERQAGGDLDADGLPDLALVLRSRDPRNVITHDGLGPSPFDSNPRILAVAFGEAGGGYRLVLQNHDLIPRPEMPTLSDPFGEGDIGIRRGVLRLRVEYFANAGGWTMFNSIFVFRWQNDRFELIGFDRALIERNTGKIENLSVNYSTRKVKIDTGAIESDATKTVWKTLPFAPMLSLGDIGDGLAYEPKY